LAVTGWGGTVSVLLGNGNGTFQAATTVSGGSNTVFAASADFNGDGKADLALANQFGSNISVLLGRGDGTFLPPVYCTVSSKPVSLTAGDFNGDGILDLAVGSSADGVILLLGNGNGTFRPGTGYSAGTSAASIGVGDFNRDGKTDLAIAIGNGPANLSGVRVSAASRDRATAGTDNVLIFQGGAGAALSASVAHTGVFVRGQTGAAFNITIANLGSAASSGAVTAVETLSAGLTATNITGTGWMCTLGTLTCTRSDALAPNSSYPAITVTVSVGSAANSPFVDTVFASGGGSGSTNATDSVTAGSCGYQLSGTNAYGSPAASGAVAIASIAGCSWSAATATSWIHLTSTTSGSGSGQVNYTIDANVAAQRSGTITVAGQAFTILQGPYVNPSGVGLRFVPVSPCRIADTRNASGPLGGPSLAAATPRNFDVRASACGIPSDAQAYSINLTVVPLGILGYLSVWPAGQPQPLVSTLNSLDGRIKANAAIVPAGTSGAITLYATDPTHAIIDINGYFVAAAGNNNLAFYPISPCRIADTRGSAGILSGPALSSMVERSFPVRSSACGVPASAQAYAMNMTVVPTSMLGFLSAWPTGSPRPNASILNALTGAITANAAIVPAGTNGDISLFATDNTQVIIDINGYFAPPGAGGMQFYSATPCRILDTRSTVGPLGGPQLAAAEQRDFSVTASTCGIPTNAGAYSLNATVVPPAALGFLSLWGSGAQPNVSTLNALDGTIVANAAIVPASSTGTVTAIVTDATQLILDINGYFAQ
jgi:hypothetical protein